MTLTPTDFLRVEAAGLRETVLRGAAFFGALTLSRVGFLATVFFGFGAALGFATFAGFLFSLSALETARFAFGRLTFAVGVRLLTPDFGVERRAAARDVERLRPFETALIEASKLKG